MRPLGIVVSAPGLDDDRPLGEAAENLPVEQVVPELGIEALNATIPPKLAGFDEGGLRTHGGDLVRYRLRHELKAIVRTDVTGNTAQNEPIRQHVNDVR